VLFELSLRNTSQYSKVFSVLENIINASFLLFAEVSLLLISELLDELLQKSGCGYRLLPSSLLAHSFSAALPLSLNGSLVKALARAGLKTCFLAITPNTLCILFAINKGYQEIMASELKISSQNNKP